MDSFEKFVKEAYLHRVRTFPWASVCDAIHNAYAHTPVKMRQIGGYGLGQRSETRLESSHKVNRVLEKDHSRKCCIYDKLLDVMNHQWLKSDPVFRKFKRVPTKKESKTPKPKNADDLIVERFIIQ